MGSNPTEGYQRFQISLLLLVGGVILGVILVAQSKTKPSRITNPALPAAELVRTREALTTEQRKLKEEIGRLRSEIRAKQEELRRTSREAKETIEYVEQLKAQIGLLPLEGPGLTVTIADSKAEATNLYTIAHAADIRDTVALLFSAGAEAISVNDERVTLQTSIDSLINTILVNSARLTSPFIIRAIGNPRALKAALENPDNLKDLKDRRRFGIEFAIREERKISILPYSGGFKVEHTKVVK